MNKDLIFKEIYMDHFKKAESFVLTKYKCLNVIRKQIRGEGG